MSVGRMVLNSRDPLPWRELVGSGHDDVYIFHGDGIWRTLDEDFYHLWLSNRELVAQLRHFFIFFSSLHAFINMVLLCFVVVIWSTFGRFMWCIYPNPPGLRHWYCDNHTITTHANDQAPRDKGHYQAQQNTKRAWSMCITIGMHSILNFRNSNAVWGNHLRNWIFSLWQTTKLPIKCDGVDGGGGYIQVCSVSDTFTKMSGKCLGTEYW